MNISAISGGGIFTTLLRLSELAISMLTIGFVLHLIVRAYWLSLVCINYVYPKGVKYEKIKLSYPFKHNTKHRSDLYEHILQADNICGLIMFLCTSCSILWMGLLFFIGCSEELTEEYLPSSVNTFMGISFVIYILDLFLSGLLRRIPYVSYIIYPIFTLLDLLTLRFVVNKGLLILKSNSPFLKRTIFITFFLLLSFIYTGEKMAQKNIKTSPFTNLFKAYDGQWLNNYKFMGHFYRDEAEKIGKKSFYSIKSKVISKNFLELKITFTHNMGQYISENDTIKTLEELYIIKINNTVVKNLNWYHWAETSTYRGLEAIISIKHLNEGEHILSIYDHSRKKIEVRDSIIYGKSTEIPFWYDKLAANNKSK